MLFRSVLGLDAQAKMVHGSRDNLACFLDGGWDVVCGDARSLPLADGAVDAVVFDAPYGRQSKIEGRLDELVVAALEEARRVAPRCVVVGDRPWARAASAAGWTTTTQRGATRCASASADKSRSSIFPSIFD